MLAEEGKNPLGCWYLSYADEEGFRGGVYIQAHGFAEAAYLSKRRGHSPGGQVMGGQVPADAIPDKRFWNRLLTKAEVQEANPDDECKTVAEFEAEKGNK